MPHISVCIATSAYNSQITVPYAESLAQLVVQLTRASIAHHFYTTSSKVCHRDPIIGNVSLHDIGHNPGTYLIFHEHKPLARERSRPAPTAPEG